jgi:integrase
VGFGEFPFAARKPAKETPEFSAYCQHYLEAYARRACKPNTVRGYEVIIDRHLVPAWQGKRLDEITRADVKQLLLAKGAEGYAAGTVKNIKLMVSALFTHAYEDEILSHNPALKLGRFLPKVDRRKHIRPLTREEAVVFLAAAREHFPESYALLLCAFRTGMRMGELLGLAWEDINFDSNTIEVRRSYSHLHFTTPKSGKARTVDMSDQLRQALLDHRGALLQQFRRGLRAVTASDGARGSESIHLVFPSRDGSPMDGDNLRHRVFYPLLEKADVPRIRFHDIRHTFASLLLQNGESVHYVKEQMGHASIQTTVDVYGHLVPGANRNAVNRLDDPAPVLRIAGPVAG